MDPDRNNSVRVWEYEEKVRYLKYYTNIIHIRVYDKMYYFMYAS